MPQSYWLVKQEPEAYAWSTLLKDKRTAWTGIRSFPARLNLRAMKKGDLVLYYHSVTEKQIVGLAKVDREAYPDPTAKEGDWSCVDLAAVKTLPRPVTLDQIKADPILRQMKLLRQTRLSVAPLTEQEFERVLELAGR